MSWLKTQIITSADALLGIYNNVNNPLANIEQDKTPQQTTDNINNKSFGNTTSYKNRE